MFTTWAVPLLPGTLATVTVDDPLRTICPCSTESAISDPCAVVTALAPINSNPLRSSSTT